jgi:hypothetical protein
VVKECSDGGTLSIRSTCKARSFFDWENAFSLCVNPPSLVKLTYAIVGTPGANNLRDAYLSSNH